MMNGLRSEFYKLYRARIFWVLLGIVSLFTLFLTGILFLEEKGLLIDQITVEVEGDERPLLGFSVLIESLKYPEGFFTYLLAAVLGSFFIASEYSNGTIKTIVSSGMKRPFIYIAKMIVTWIGDIYIYISIVVTFTVFTALFFSFGPLPSSQEWVEALQAFGLTCLLIGSFSAIITFFSILVRSSAIALFTTLGFYFVFATGLDMLAAQYTLFENVRNYSVFDYMALMSFETAHDGTFFMSLTRVALVTLILFTTLGMVLFQRKDIQ